MPAGFTVRDLPLRERPRERLTRLGPEALSEQELLACVLGRGIGGESVLVSAQRLLARFGSLRGIAQASVEQLLDIRGIGSAKAVQLKAAVEIARRVSDEPSGERPMIDSLEAAVAIARPHLLERPKEHVIALLLDARHRLIRVAPIALGSLTASLVHPREVFREAMAAGAAAVILAHNHPSGDPEPSADDVELTHRLEAAGRLVGIELLDHVIVASQGVASLRGLGAIDRRPAARRRRVAPAEAPASARSLPPAAQLGEDCRGVAGDRTRRMRGAAATAALALALLAAAPIASVSAAEDPPVGGSDRIEQAMSRYNLHPAFEKLGRGASNVLAGWMEIPLGVGRRYSTSDTAGSVLTGAAVGAFRGVVRTAVGLYETVTFFLPYPEHYAPILPTLEYFRRDTRRERLPLE